MATQRSLASFFKKRENNDSESSQPAPMLQASTVSLQAPQQDEQPLK
jgi:hypothetical protein